MKVFSYFEETYIKFLRIILIILVFISLISALGIFLTGVYKYAGVGISKPKSINQEGSRPEIELENKNGKIGISTEYIRESNILVIKAVTLGSPANLAELQINDFITRIDGKVVKKESDLAGLPDSNVTLTIVRDEKKAFDVTLKRVSPFYISLPLTDSEELEARRKQEEQRDNAEKNRLALEKEKQLFASKKQSEFRKQSEKLAQVSRTFLELKKRDDLITLSALSNQIFDKIKDYKIKVLCSPFYYNAETKKICESPLYEGSNSKSGKILEFDIVDLSENSVAFFGKNINYFEIQINELNNTLDNEKIKNLYMEDKIKDPIVKALNFNHRNIQKSIYNFYEKGQAIIKSKGIKVDMTDYYSDIEYEKESGIKLLSISLGVFAAFISLMLLIVFYKIERHLKLLTNRN
jgi:hypothetical protein